MARKQTQKLWVIAGGVGVLYLRMRGSTAGAVTEVPPTESAVEPSLLQTLATNAHGPCLHALTAQLARTMLACLTIR